MVIGARVGLVLVRLDGEQLACAREVLDASAVGEEALVADAVKAVGQHVEEEAADELRRCEGHDLVAVAAFCTVILPGEGDAVVVEADQAAVGDGDAVGVAAEIGEHRFRPGEGPLGVDHPFKLA